MFETTQERLARSRDELAQVQEELFASEADLADRRAEVHAFEAILEARLGGLTDRLATLQSEIETYMERVERMRNETVFGTSHASVESQYRRTWHRPPTSASLPPREPPSPATEAQIKQLYRKLARRFHPDLAVDEAERLYRTEKMAAVNDAYAARSLAELLALEQESAGTPVLGGRSAPNRTEGQMVQALRDEIGRCRRRLREIVRELNDLDLRPSVQLQLEIKMARRQGRDILQEMETELKRKVARLEVERDLLKSQFEHLNLPPRIGPNQEQR